MLSADTGQRATAHSSARWQQEAFLQLFFSFLRRKIGQICFGGGLGYFMFKPVEKIWNENFDQ